MLHQISSLIRQIPLALLLLFAASLVRADLGAVEQALAEGDLAAAEALLAPLLQEDRDGEARLAQGRLLMAQGEAKSAYKVLKEVAEVRAEDPDAHFQLGMAAAGLAANASMFTAGKYAGVVRKSFTRALELDPDNTNALQGLIGFHTQAPGIVGGKKKEALRLAQQLATIEPVEGYVALASVHGAMGNDDLALQALETLTTEMPDEPRGWLQLGFQAQGDEDWSEANKLFGKAAEVGTDSDVHDRARASALYQVGRTAVFSGTRQSDGIEALTTYLERSSFEGLPGKDWANYR
ncbi:MAG: tetratricopeptide repeat protein, partial [Pseudomonadota bacterium]